MVTKARARPSERVPGGAVHTASHCPGVRKTRLMFSALETMPSSWAFSITTSSARLDSRPGEFAQQNK